MTDRLFAVYVLEFECATKGERLQAGGWVDFEKFDDPTTTLVKIGISRCPYQRALEWLLRCDGWLFPKTGVPFRLRSLKKMWDSGYLLETYARDIEGVAHKYFKESRLITYDGEREFFMINFETAVDFVRDKVDELKRERPLVFIDNPIIDYKFRESYEYWDSCCIWGKTRGK